MLTQEMNVPILEPDAKKDRLKILVDYFTVNRNNHTFYAFKFFLCELLNFINVVGQIYFMDFFLDGEFTTYGKYRVGVQAGLRSGRVQDRSGSGIGLYFINVVGCFLKIEINFFIGQKTFQNLKTNG